MQLMFQREFKWLSWVTVGMGCSMIIHGEVRHFSADALVLFQQEANREFPLCTNDSVQISEKSKKRLTTEQLYSYLNTLACIYALARIAHTYRSHFVADVHPTTWYDNLIPLRNTLLVKKIRFGIATTLILGETFLGKSLAKLLILCVTGDVSDLIEAMVIRVKKVVVG